MSDRTNWLLRMGTLTVMGIVLVIIGLVNLVPTWKSPVDIFNKDFSELEEKDHAQFEIEYVLGCCVSVTTERTRNGVKVSSDETSRLYLVPSMIEYENGAIGIDRYYLVEVPKKDFAHVEALCDDFWDKYDYDWENYGVMYSGSDFVNSAEPYFVDGVLEETVADERKYAYEIMRDELGFTTEEVDEYLLSALKVNAMPNTGNVFLICGAILAVIGGAIFAIILIKGKKEKEIALENNAQNGAYNGNPAYNANNGAAAGNNYGANYNGTAAVNNGANNNAVGNNAAGTQEKAFTSGMFSPYNAFDTATGTAPETAAKTETAFGETSGTESSSAINLNGVMYDPNKPQQ